MVVKDGTVFTKEWVVSMMLDISGYVPSNDLSSISILEPSCGEGAFLIPIVERLLDSLRPSNVNVHSLEGSIKAFDLDPAKVLCTRQKINNLLIKKGFSIEDSKYLSNNWIQCGDFLTLDIQHLFDIVIGNPPYIKSADLDYDTRLCYKSTLETMTMGTDIFVGFLEKGLKLLNADGKLCYICADRWMQNSYGKKIRKFILNNHSMDLICRMHDVDAFEEKVSAYPAIVLINSSDKDTVFVDCSSSFNENDATSLIKSLKTNDYSGNHSFQISSISNLDSSGGPWLLADTNTAQLISLLNKQYPSLEDTGVSIGIGVATGRDEVFITDKCDLVEDDRLLPLLCNKDIVSKSVPNNPLHWLINPWNSEGNLVNLDSYPKLSEYYQTNFDALSSRHIVKKNSSQWYRTIDKIYADLQTRPKLLFSDLSSRSDPIYDHGRFYPHHNLYWCTSDSWNLEALGGFFLSSQVESIIDAYGVKMRGKTMRFQAQYLRMIHLPYPDRIDEGNLNELKRAFLNRNRDMASEIVSYIISEA